MNRGQAARSASNSHRGFLPRHLGSSAGGTGCLNRAPPSTSDDPSSAPPSPGYAPPRECNAPTPSSSNHPPTTPPPPVVLPVCAPRRESGQPKGPAWLDKVAFSRSDVGSIDQRPYRALSPYHPRDHLCLTAQNDAPDHLHEQATLVALGLTLAIITVAGNISLGRPTLPVPSGLRKTCRAWDA